jgi:hypothetical protein
MLLLQAEHDDCVVCDVVKRCTMGRLNLAPSHDVPARDVLLEPIEWAPFR